MTGEPSVIDALAVLLAEAEDSIAHDDPRAYVGVEAAVARLTSVCDDPDLTRMEYAPHRVPVVLEDDGRLWPSGSNELLDAAWEETTSYWCRTCDREIEGHLVAKAHAQGIDLVERVDG